MANEVNLTIRVGDQGTLNIVAKEAKAAAKSVDGVTEASNRATSARNRYSKGEKGVAGATANSTKAFSKMRESMSGGGGLVAAYATLAANAFALSAAFGVLQRAAAFQQLANGLNLIGSQAGKNLPGVAEGLRDITGAAISTEQALRATAVATTSGFSTEQLTRLTKVAKGASQALGRNLPDALDRLVRGTAKLEPEILDELGIIVRLDEATRKYAASLGKPVSQLTTFERQQAFLNATIEQGEKKYGALADRLDTNVYDKLAASFSDLAKDIIYVIDFGIEPLIKFLSQNKFALFSTMLLFVSSISKAIIPSIQSVALANKAMAASAMADSKKAGTVVSKAYTSQLSKVVGTVNTIPKSFEKILPSIKNNTVTVKELQSAVINLKRSEELRFAALRAKGLEASGQKVKEYNETVALRQETERLIALESKRTALNASGTRARGVGTGAGLTARGLQQMDRATGTLQKFGVAAKYSRLQLANVGKTFTTTAKTVGRGTAVFNAARVSITALTGSVRLFGAALLNAIPVIGQILFAVSLVAPFIMDLFGPSDAEKNIAKATASFKSFSKIAVELARSLAAARTEGEAVYATLKTGAGVIDQVSGSFSKLQEAQLNTASTDVEDNIKKIVAKTKELGEMTRIETGLQQRATDARLKGQTSIAESEERGLAAYRIIMQSRRDEIAELSAANKTLLDKTQIVDQASAIDILQKSIIGMESSGLSEVLKDDYAFLKDLLARVMGTGDEIITVAQAMEELNARGTSLNGTVSTFDGLNEKVSQFNASVTKLGEKGKTEFDEVTTAVGALSVELSSLSKKDGGAILVEEFLGTTDGKKVKSVVANAVQAFGAVEGAAIKTVKNADGSIAKIVDETKTNYVTALETVKKKLDENNQKILESAANAKNLTNQAKALSEAAKFNAAIVTVQVDLENQAKQARIEGLQATRQNLIATVGQEEAKERIAQLDAEIGALNADIADKAEKTFRQANAKIKADQRLLKLARQKTAAVKEEFQATQALRKSNLAVTRSGTNSGVTAQDEARILKDAQVEAKRIEDEALENKKKGIELEFKLLNAQLTLEQAKLDRLLKEGKISKEDHGSVTATISAAQTAATATETAMNKAADARTKANKGIIDNNVLLAEARAIEEKRLALLQQQEQTVSRLSGLGLDFLASSAQRAIFESEQLRIQTDIDNLSKTKAEREKNAAAILAKQLELQGLITDEMLRQKGLRDEQASKLEGASATAAASLRASVPVDAASKTYDAAVEGGDPEAIAAAKIELTRQSALALSEITAGIAEDMRKLGPEGELMGATMEAVSNITTTFVGAFDVMADKSSTTAQKVQAGLAATSALMQGFAQVSKASSDARIRGIDQEIAAEKKRDGKSAESIAKIKGLEDKKLKEQKKAFETEKKMKIAQTIISTAQGAISAYTSLAAIPFVGPALGAAAAAAVVAMGMKQVQMIQSTTFQGGGSAGGASAPSSVSVGQRSNSVDMAKSQGAGGELAYMRGGKGVGGPENFTPAFAGYRNRAEGGNTAFMVGEQGPELFVPEKAGRIVPNDDVQASTPVNANINISAIDAAGVEDVLINQRGNIISMIREAANAQGDGFLENINVAEL